jgi:nitroreductase
MASTPSWAVEHCTLVAENLMLAARTAGLATCWIGFAQTYNTRRKGRARAAAGLPADRAVGHPASFPPPVPRKAADINWIG